MLSEMLEYFTRGSHKSLAVAIYSQIKSRNCQHLVVYYWRFKVKVISFFIIVHSPRGVQNSKLFVSQKKCSCSKQLFNVRKTIFKNFFSHFFSVFEQLNEVWVVGYLALRAFFQCRCFLVQSQHSSIGKQGLWNVVFTLLYCH